MAELISLGRLVPALAACFGASYLAFDQVAHRKIFGGTRPEDMPTLAADWKLATEARRLSTARSATESSPVVLDPITAGIPPSYKPEPFGGDDEDD